MAPSPSLTSRGVTTVAAAFAASLWAFWPSLGAYYFLDDYGFVAITRYTDHPLAYYLAEHFPGGLFYRPSGMLLWWLTTEADLAPRAQFVLNWLLLGSASALLGQLLRMLGMRNGIALGGSLLFAVHPIAVSTAGWLSNRFDLLVTIGVLLALIGTLLAGHRGKVAGLGLTAVGTLLAVTSKELGFVTPIAVIALCHGSPVGRLFAKPFLLSAALAGGIFVVRGLLLPGTEKILYPGGLFDAARRGTIAWTNLLPEFVAFVPGHPLAANLLGLVVVVALLAALAVLAMTRLRARHSEDRSHATAWTAVTLGVAIFASAALVQSPTVARTMLGVPTAQAFYGDAYLSARFYYLALAGFLIAGAGLATAAAGSRSDSVASPHPGRALSPSGATAPTRRVRTAAVGAVLAFVALYWGWQSRVQGRLWSAESSGANRAIASAAADAALAAAPRDAASREACRIFLVDTIEVSSAFWRYADSAVKAAVPKADARRLGSCIVSTENTPWFNVLRIEAAGGSAARPSSPFEPICVFGKVLPPLTIDSVFIHFLSYPRAGATLRIADGDRVLRYDRQSRKFDDVTARVAGGESAVRLNWSRSVLNACPDARPAA